MLCFVLHLGSGNYSSLHSKLVFHLCEHLNTLRSQCIRIGDFYWTMYDLIYKTVIQLIWTDNTKRVITALPTWILTLKILNGTFCTDFYCKRNTFSLSIVNFPHMATYSRNLASFPSHPNEGRAWEWGYSKPAINSQLASLIFEDMLQFPGFCL